MKHVNSWLTLTRVQRAINVLLLPGHLPERAQQVQRTRYPAPGCVGRLPGQTSGTPGDGQPDNARAPQRALRTCPRPYPPRISIYLSAGDYLVSDPGSSLSDDYDDHVTIRG